MKQAKHIEVVNKLIDNGWSIDHTALYNGYLFAGTISPMKTRNNIEYCRVHTGKCKTEHTYQITIVMKRGIVK